MASIPLIAGVELGGTKCIASLATGPNDIRVQEQVPTTTPDETLSALRAILERWHAEHDFAAIGIASFGPVDLDRASASYGWIVNTPKPGWNNADVVGALGLDGVAVAFDTDVNGAALAEKRWGAAQGLESFAYVTIGTGIGVGSVVNGRPVAGLGHSEAGHMLVGRFAGDKFAGNCPFHGDCLEGLANGPAIRAATGKPAEDLDADDPAWDRVVDAIAGMAFNLALTTVPQRILIGGGVMAGQPQLMERIRETTVAKLAGYAHAAAIASDIDNWLTEPGLGTMAGPMGAIALGLGAV